MARLRQYTLPSDVIRLLVITVFHEARQITKDLAALALANIKIKHTQDRIDVHRPAKYPAACSLVPVLTVVQLPLYIVFN